MPHRADPADLVRASGGHARWRDLQAICGPAAVRRSVADGRLVRLTRGVYGCPDLPVALQAAARLGGVLSHTSAAAYWGMQVMVPPDRPHVLLPRNRSRATGVHAHRPRGPVEVNGPATSPLQTLLDCARTLPYPEALAVADSALHLQLVGPSELMAAAEGLRGPGRARALRVARTADPRPQSGLESVVRAAIDGVAHFEPQVVIRDETFYAEVDLADTDLMLVVEAEGYQFHAGQAEFARDCVRYNDLVCRGWLVLRISWGQAMFEPQAVRAAVQTLIRLRRVERARRYRSPGHAKAA